ncbi:universal stress protein [Aquamicrobium sp. LC103]|uniref:universal stress protein n=1 Tax=Aquamicrobium sp. LC103 TaxID=1120658 RepID=UPI00063E7C5A|nr:universal stress protein [Aquamicrobium sp. LC103]TKT74400.1 universal stress protein [Aquamicrobium sp. LC103]
MYGKVLLAYDGSVEGRLALREGAKLAKLCGAEVFLLAVVDISVGIMLAEGAAPGAVEQQKEVYQKVLAEGVERLEQHGFAPQARLEFGDPAHEIVAVANEIGADLVVVGHRHQSAFARWWNGSVGASVLEGLRCSLLIAQNDAGETAASGEVSDD